MSNESKNKFIIKKRKKEGINDRNRCLSKKSQMRKIQERGTVINNKRKYLRRPLHSKLKIRLKL